MKKTLALLVALVGSIGLTAPAHAFLIDGFGDAQAVDTSFVSSNTFSPLTDTDFTNASRDYTVTTGGIGDVTMNSSGGTLQYSQESQTTGTGLVEWYNFGTETFTGPIQILVSVVFSDNIDLDSGTVGDAAMTLFMSNGVTGVSDTLAIPFTSSGDSILFTLSPTDLAGVNYVSMFIDGSTQAALDLTIDFIETPAPGVLGLIGLGLLALGFTTRRRRQ